MTTTPPTMRHLDLFTGIGGFTLAAHAAGMVTVAHSEIDLHASRCLERNFPVVPNLGDITTTEGYNLNVNIITAGSPCQDFSVAGNRSGAAGARSGLISHAFRLAHETQAEWLVLENVPGLLSSNGGRDMGAVLRAMADLGMGYAWRVLDAQAFGVPQRRRRVFIVGRVGGSFYGPSEVLHVGQGLSRDTPAFQDSQQHPASSGQGSPGEDCYSIHTQQTPITALEYTHCMSTNRTIGVVQGDTTRHATPTECERLQGYPDGWTLGSSDTQRYKQLGNSVAVPVVSWVMSRIAEVQSTLLRDPKWDESDAVMMNRIFKESNA